MLTRNFYNFLSVAFLYKDKILTFTDTNGKTRYLAGIGSDVVGFTSSIRLSTGRGISFGTGSKESSIDDYKLEQQITSGLSAIFARTNDGLLITLSNTSESEIVIRELGYFGYSNHFSSPTATTTTQYNYMLDRTVLDDPLIIPAGEIGTIRYLIKFDI